MSLLTSPVTFRTLTIKNRMAVAPMCQYSAKHGVIGDYHLVHLGRFALGGFGLVIVEATAVSPEGRISYGCTGLWDDGQIGGMKRVVDLLHSQGVAAGIQLAHAGRKAASPIPWRGGFTESESDKIACGFEDWTPVAPSAERHMPSYKLPTALTEGAIAELVSAFAAAAQRAQAAGFDLIEIHSAHGYLLNQFLSPIANRRTDKFGGSRASRMRFPLQVVEAMRAAWPKEKPLFMRVSITDWIDGGWDVEDSIAYAQAAKERGVDLIHCTTGGFDGAAVKPGPGYQVEFAAAVKHGAGIPTMAVGLIITPADAERILREGKADMIALARPALDNPNWAAHAARLLDHSYDLWPKQAAYAVKAKDAILARV